MAHRTARNPESVEFNHRIASLLSAYQDGDNAAAHEFVEALNPMLYRYFAAHSRNPHAAEDLTQDFWIRLHQARASYRRGEPVLPWVFAIARFARIDDYRKRRRSEPNHAASPGRSLEPSIDPRQGLVDHLSAAQILGRLDELPDGQREVFIMLKVSGMSLDQIARATASSTGAVKQKVYRACESLRKLFGRGMDRDERGGPR